MPASGGKNSHPHLPFLPYTCYPQIPNFPGESRENQRTQVQNTISFRSFKVEGKQKWWWQVHVPQESWLDNNVRRTRKRICPCKHWSIHNPPQNHWKQTVKACSWECLCSSCNVMQTPGNERKPHLYLVCFINVLKWAVWLPTASLIIEYNGTIVVGEEIL